jgi:hypothetical protein
LSLQHFVSNQQSCEARQTETMHTFWVLRIQVRPLFIFPIRGQHSKAVKSEMVFLFQKASHEHIPSTHSLDVAVCFLFDTVNSATPLRRLASTFRPMRWFNQLSSLETTNPVISCFFDIFLFFAVRETVLHNTCSGTRENNAVFL